MRIILTVTNGPDQGQRFTFEGHDNFLVGRSKEAHFRLPDQDKNVSRLHFMVEVNPPHCQLMDMGSRNGTFVNEQRVTATAALKDGDCIRAGHTTLRVSMPDSAPLPAAAPVRAAAKGAGVKFVSPHAGPQPQGPGKTCVACSSPVPAGSTPDRANLVFSYLCPSCREQVRKQVQIIDGYQIVKEVGHGGMGVVYLALRSANGALTALKTIKPTVVCTEAHVQKFIREASILCDLDHPNIVGYREMGESDGILYFAMDYVCGIDVAHLLKNHGPLPIARAVRLTCQLLDALAYAHAKGFVHRDIKPANLLVTTAGGQRPPREPSAETVLLVDFGLARAYQSSQLSGLTMTGQFAGTIEFMAPEQITSFRDAKPSVDQYAAAATLYTLLTGKYVYDLPSSAHQRLLMILQQDPVPIQSRRADVPKELAGIIHRGLAREPKKRFADVGEMRQALEKIRQ